MRSINSSHECLSLFPCEAHDYLISEILEDSVYEIHVLLLHNFFAAVTKEASESVISHFLKTFGAPNICKVLNGSNDFSYVALETVDPLVILNQIPLRLDLLIL